MFETSSERYARVRFSLFLQTYVNPITDLEWKVVYVGSASDGKFDQELDSVLVGPIPVGVNKFVFHVRSIVFSL